LAGRRPLLARPTPIQRRRGGFSPLEAFTRFWVPESRFPGPGRPCAARRYRTMRLARRSLARVPEQ
jgi:hypothetical protein